MIYRIVKVFVPLSTLLLLGACGGIACGNAHVYQDSVARGPLKAPAGITVPPPDSAYVIPGAATATSPQSLPCMIQPPELIPAVTTAKKPPAAKPAATVAAPAKAVPAAGTSQSPANAVPAAASATHPAGAAPASTTGSKPGIATPPSME